MTKTEFLQALDKHEQVKFDGSELRGPTSHASAILSDALMTILPDEEQIRFGVEMSSFTEFTWEGQLVWLLVLRAHLLELVSRVRPGDKEGDEIEAFLVTHRVLPVDNTLRVESTFEYPPHRGAPIASASARISLGGAQFDLQAAHRRRLTPKGIGSFLAALIESASR